MVMLQYINDLNDAEVRLQWTPRTYRPVLDV